MKGFFYFFTSSLVFSAGELGSLMEDMSAPRSCCDAIILGAANTYRIRNRHNIDLRISMKILGKGCS